MEMYGNSAPLNGRKSKLPPSPNKEMTGKPQAAHPPPTIPKSELPPAIRWIFLIFLSSIILSPIRVIFIPVRTEVISINKRANGVMLVVMPKSRDEYSFILENKLNDRKVSLIKTIFRR